MKKSIEKIEKPDEFMALEPAAKSAAKPKERKQANGTGAALNRDERMFIVLLIAFFIMAALLIALVIVFARSLAAPPAPDAADAAWNPAASGRQFWNAT
jgi:hypothetical protein